ncbi:hypothetical protein ACQPZK_23670 [Micromonospora sp. CA-249363]|uniref:hypothetical protein n=1 Tax=Micromonospora sp. CA-249363 TaxID=3239963 RepID=UPI003D8D9D2B
MSLGRVPLLGGSRIAPRSRVVRRREALPIAPTDKSERRHQQYDERSERYHQTRHAIEATGRAPESELLAEQVDELDGEHMNGMDKHFLTAGAGPVTVVLVTGDRFNTAA